MHRLGQRKIRINLPEFQRRRCRSTCPRTGSDVIEWIRGWNWNLKRRVADGAENRVEQSMLSDIAAIIVDVLTDEAEIRDDAVDLVVALKAATLTYITITSADWAIDAGSSYAMPDTIDSGNVLGLWLPRRVTLP